jgi:type IV pilus assembly protein PilO
MNFGLDKYQDQLEKLARLPRAARMALVPLVVIFSIAVYGYVFYMPSNAERATLEDQGLQLQRKLAEVRSVANNKDAVQQEIAVLEKKLAIALRQLPDDKELPVLLTDITSLGKNAGLEFKAFRPQLEVTRAFYAEVPIDIEFTGQYHDIATFFDEISRLPRIVNVGELQVSIARESTTGTYLNVVGQATTFRFVEPEGDVAMGRGNE